MLVGNSVLEIGEDVRVIEEINKRNKETEGEELRRNDRFTRKGGGEG